MRNYISYYRAINFWWWDEAIIVFGALSLIALGEHTKVFEFQRWNLIYHEEKKNFWPLILAPIPWWMVEVDGTSKVSCCESFGVLLFFGCCCCCCICGVYANGADNGKFTMKNKIHHRRTFHILSLVWTCWKINELRTVCCWWGIWRLEILVQHNRNKVSALVNSLPMFCFDQFSFLRQRTLRPKVRLIDGWLRYDWTVKSRKCQEKKENLSYIQVGRLFSNFLYQTCEGGEKDGSLLDGKLNSPKAANFEIFMEIQSTAHVK